MSKTVSGLLSYKTTKTAIFAQHETSSPSPSYTPFHVCNVAYGPGRRGPHASDKKFLKFLSSSIAYYFTSYQSLVLKRPNAHIAHAGKQCLNLRWFWLFGICYKMNMSIIFPTSSTRFSVKCEQRHDTDSCGVRLILCFDHHNCNMWRAAVPVQSNSLTKQCLFSIIEILLWLY